MGRCKRILSLLAIIAGLGPAVAWAQLAGMTVPSTGESLTLELNEGQLLRLDTPASSVFIANPNIADVSVRSSRLVYLFGLAPGQTTLYALDRNDNVIANLEVVVQHNLARLRKALGTLVPASDVTVASVDGAIILSGTVATAEDAENARRLAARFIGSGEEVINRLGVTEPNQVNLRVRIAEVSREILNRFGFNWDLLLNGEFVLGLTTTRPILEATNFLQGIGSIGELDVNGLIDALADDGLITVLAEPNLTALNGETASFLAGGEFPIPVSQDDDSITVEFHDFGVSLAFTPTILNNNRINMRVRPEVSQLSSAGAVTLGGISLPALTTRRAETTVELASGQSFAIAGLLQNTSQELIEKTPGLGDLPILGALFKSERFERNETELVIIVTPYLVRPVSGRVPLPTDAFTGPAPEAIQPRNPALSRTVPIPSQGPAADGQTSSAGYILD